VVGSRQYADNPSDRWHDHGTAAGNSVVNSYGQTHEIPNLYVAGPGIFATSGASNPTYTIFALSLRGAEQLAASWGSVTD
jgi:choline dehydrogenase-like flavoprotein